MLVSALGFKSSRCNPEILKQFLELLLCEMKCI